MPIYRAEWPTEDANRKHVAVIRARNIDQVFDMIDMVEDPSLVKVKRLHGNFLFKMDIERIYHPDETDPFTEHRVQEVGFCADIEDNGELAEELFRPIERPVEPSYYPRFE